MKLEHFTSKWEYFPSFEDFISGQQSQFVLESLERLLLVKSQSPEETKNPEESQNPEDSQSLEATRELLPAENEEELEEFDESTVNFVLIRGEAMSGKSHLLEATARRMKELAPQSRVLFAQARELIPFFSDQKKYPKKMQELEKVDLFLIDNIHLLSTEKECQEELNQLLDILAKKNALVISSYSLTYDLTNQAIFNANTTINQGLFSRLSSGVILNISPPNIDILMRYTQRECERIKLPFTKSMCLTLARFCYDIRQLQGILKTIESHAKTNKIAFTDSILTNFLKDFEGKKEITPDLIISVSAQYFSLQAKDLRGKGRLANTVKARQISMYLCRKLLAYSYPRIAKLYGGKDHTTIMYACEKVEKDPLLQALAHNLSQKIILESSISSNI